jgi:hypothetical protein
MVNHANENLCDMGFLSTDDSILISAADIRHLSHLAFSSIVEHATFGLPFLTL